MNPIFCKLCNKLVDKAVWVDYQTTDKVAITVYCHGEKDEMEVSRRDLTAGELSQLDRSVGFAFAKAVKKVEAQIYSHGKDKYCFGSYVGAMHDNRQCYDCKDLYECRRVKPAINVDCGECPRTNGCTDKCMKGSNHE